jgi:hypothetical protein
MSASFISYIKNIGRSLEKERSSNELQQPKSSTIQPTDNEINLKADFTVSASNSNYANIFVISANKEEVIVKFGVHQNWERPDEINEIDLSSRVILSPYVAKRLSIVLKRLIDEYEKRYIDVNIESIEQLRMQAAAATKH